MVKSRRRSSVGKSKRKVKSQNVVYAPERIVAQHENGLLYLIRWPCTWEPEKNLLGNIALDEWRNSTHGNNNESEDEIKFTDDMEVEFLEDKDTFDVDKILEERTVNNKVQYLVKWEDTWVLGSDPGLPPNLIHEFNDAAQPTGKKEMESTNKQPLDEQEANEPQLDTEQQEKNVSHHGQEQIEPNFESNQPESENPQPETEQQHLKEPQVDQQLQQQPIESQQKEIVSQSERELAHSTYTVQPTPSRGLPMVMIPRHSKGNHNEMATGSNMKRKLSNDTDDGNGAALNISLKRIKREPKSDSEDSSDSNDADDESESESDSESNSSSSANSSDGNNNRNVRRPMPNKIKEILKMGIVLGQRVVLMKHLDDREVACRYETAKKHYPYPLLDFFEKHIEYGVNP